MTCFYEFLQLTFIITSNYKNILNYSHKAFKTNFSRLILEVFNLRGLIIKMIIKAKIGFKD